MNEVTVFLPRTVYCLHIILIVVLEYQSIVKFECTRYKSHEVVRVLAHNDAVSHLRT